MNATAGIDWVTRHPMTSWGDRKLQLWMQRLQSIFHGQFWCHSNLCTSCPIWLGPSAAKFRCQRGESSSLFKRLRHARMNDLCSPLHWGFLWNPVSHWNLLLSCITYERSLTAILGQPNTGGTGRMTQHCRQHVIWTLRFLLVSPAPSQRVRGSVLPSLPQAVLNHLSVDSSIMLLSSWPPFSSEVKSASVVSCSCQWSHQQ